MEDEFAMRNIRMEIAQLPREKKSEFFVGMQTDKQKG
jgi:hypothetical protein